MTRQVKVGRTKNQLEELYLLLMWQSRYSFDPKNFCASLQLILILLIVIDNPNIIPTIYMENWKLGPWFDRKLYCVRWTEGSYKFHIEFPNDSKTLQETKIYLTPAPTTAILLAEAETPHTHTQYSVCKGRKNKKGWNEQNITQTRQICLSCDSNVWLTGFTRLRHFGH